MRVTHLTALLAAVIVAAASAASAGAFSDVTPDARATMTAIVRDHASFSCVPAALSQDDNGKTLKLTTQMTLDIDGNNATVRYSMAFLKQKPNGQRMLETGVRTYTFALTDVLFARADKSSIGCAAPASIPVVCATEKMCVSGSMDYTNKVLGPHPKVERESGKRDKLAGFHLDLDNEAAASRLVEAAETLR